MPIPDERLPEAEELIDEDSESAMNDPIADTEEELEFETADVDSDDFIVNDDAVERDTASFGFGDPAD